MLSRMVVSTLFILLISTTWGIAQSLSGLQVGDLLSTTDKIGLAPITRNQTGPFTVEKWEFPDGNELSVTAETSSQQIVYIESDWGNRQSGSNTDFPGFFYGKTALSDIRRKFGNNGFAFKSNAMIRTPDGIISFNCYQFSNNANLIAAFVTRVPMELLPTIARNKNSFANLASLEAIILADLSYLHTIWGSEKVFDPAYSPIQLR